MGNSFKGDEALATLLVSTRRKKRPVSLVELYQALQSAIEKQGNIRSVAESVGLTAKMLNQFMAVGKVTPTVRDFIESRQIDSVDAVSQIASLPVQDQALVAEKVALSNWNTEDVRAFRDLRRRSPETAAEALLDKVSSAKSTSEYLIEITVRGGLNSESILTRLTRHIEPSTVKSIEISGTKATIAVNRDGLTKLRKLANKKKNTLATTLSHIIYEI